MFLFAKRALIYLLLYSVGIFYGFMMLCRLLWSVFREGAEILKYTPKERAPSCLTDESLGVHNYVTTKSNMKFHYVAKGELGKPLMLCVHGFPEFWYSWRFQLREFSNNYRVVAIDLRGYGLSDKPKKMSSYNITYLTQDIKEIVEGLGYSSCILLGHDWGGIISWSVAHRFPDIVDRLIIFNCPHPNAFLTLVTSWKQFLMSWYVFFYQLPYLPEKFLSLKDFSIIKAVFRGNFAGVKNKANMTDDDIEAYKFTISQPGATSSALNYYRNIVPMLIDQDCIKNGQKKITAPTLVVWGDHDRFLRKESLNNLTSLVDSLKIRYVGGASHWVQQDEPQIVNDIIRKFLEE